MTALVPFNRAHLDAVVAIEQEAYAGQDPWSRVAFESELLTPFSLWWVAVEGDRVAGYAGGWTLQGEFHLLNIAVARGSRGRGVGRALLDATLAAAADRGCRTATLEVREGNGAARRLYESAGFRAEGLRRGFYPDGAHAVVYCLNDLGRPGAAPHAPQPG